MSIAKDRLKELEKGKCKKPSKKKKDKGLNNRSLYMITLTNFFTHVYELILTINCINKDKFIDSQFGMQKKNIKFNKKFKKLSKLHWDETSEPGSADFNGKLITIYLFHIIREADHLIQRSYSKQYHGEKRFKTCNMLLNNIIERTDLLIVGLLTRDFSYHEPLHAMTQMIILANGDGNLLKVLDDTFAFLEKECKKDNLDPGVIMNNIMKTAYILSTLDLHLKKTPKFIEGDYRGNDEVMKAQVSQLGYAIMKAQSKGRSSLFYDIMMEAKPKIYARWDDVNEYPELAIGCQALNLLMIYMDDPNVTRWIKKMIE